MSYLLVSLLLFSNGVYTFNIAPFRQPCLANAQTARSFGSCFQSELSAITSGPFSVFSTEPLPLTTLPKSTDFENVVKAVDDNCLNAYTSDTTTTGQRPLFASDHFLGDPPGAGIAVSISCLYRELHNVGTTSATACKNAVSSQLEYLKAQEANRATWSHRNSDEYWIEFVQKVPPFLAWMSTILEHLTGAREEHATLFETAYNQIFQYRWQLQNPSTKLWAHIKNGAQQDPKPWATGNAMAAHGMLLVVSIAKRSSISTNPDYQTKIEQIGGWIQEILDAAYASDGYNKNDGTFRNYLDNAAGSTDQGASALMAACSYRMAELLGKADHVEKANTAFNTLNGMSSPTLLAQDVQSDSQAGVTGTSNKVAYWVELNSAREAHG